MKLFTLNTAKIEVQCSIYVLAWLCVTAFINPVFASCEKDKLQNELAESPYRPPGSKHSLDTDMRNFDLIAIRGDWKSIEEFQEKTKKEKITILDNTIDLLEKLDQDLSAENYEATLDRLNSVIVVEKGDETLNYGKYLFNSKADRLDELICYSSAMIIGGGVGFLTYRYTTGFGNFPDPGDALAIGGASVASWLASMIGCAAMSVYSRRLRLSLFLSRLVDESHAIRLAL